MAVELRWARSPLEPFRKQTATTFEVSESRWTTIPLVGEADLAEAVRAVARLPRARAVVLAGALMGGEIEDAVREVQQKGLLVVSLNMAGSVPQAADLVVTDPIQAGVMAVMAVSDTGRFQIPKLTTKIF